MFLKDVETVLANEPCGPADRTRLVDKPESEARLAPPTNACDRMTRDRLGPSCHALTLSRSR